MQRKHASFRNCESVLVAEIASHCRAWLLDGEIAQHSPRTLQSRRDIVDKLLWFLRSQDCTYCGVEELRLYFGYLNHGHTEPGGRWGNPHMTRPLRPRSVETYHGHLRSFWNWMVAEQVIEHSAMEVIPCPIARERKKVQPFATEQLQALYDRAKFTDYPQRNRAILDLLLDTGMRSSEMCGLRFKDVDVERRKCTVTGKGNKQRDLWFSAETAKSLWAYLRKVDLEQNDSFFRSERGRTVGGGMTPSGVRRMVSKLGAAAQLKAVRCSPHTLRHTYATEFLRDGGNQFALQQSLGHTSLHQTSIYVEFVQADVERQQRMHSPVQRLRGKRR